MKELILLITILNFTISQAQIVNIPDANFKNALLNYNPTIDTNNDGEIQVDEATTFTGFLNISSNSISDLTGIADFVNITQLECKHNQLTTLNVSNNTALTNLGCGNNQLTSLDVSNNTNLTFLLCNYNQLTSLNVSNNNALTHLGCSDNQLTTLDVSNNTALIYLRSDVNQLTTLDISNNSALNYLYCYNNQLTTLDISNNLYLTDLGCGSNQINTLNVSNNTDLTNLGCGNNQLTSLNLNNNIVLSSLICNDNQLTTLDMSNNNTLTHLICGDNQLTTLDVSDNTSLTVLQCNNNQNLTYINLKNGTNDNINTTYSIFQNLPSLQIVCVDELNTYLTTFIINETGYSVNFATDCSTLSIDNNYTIDFSVYPTPTENILNIKSIREIVKIKIYSKLGQLIKITTKNRIDISNLTQGLYFVKVEDVNGNFGVKKIVKK